MKKSGWFLPSILILALVLRLLFIFQVKGDIHWRNLSPNTDSYYYHLTGIRVAEGKGVGKDFDLNPLYPLLIIGPIYRIFGTNILLLRIFQILLGTLNVFIFFLLLKRLFSTKIAYFSSLILSVYPPLIVYDASIQPLILENLFLLSSLFFLIKGRDKKYFSFFSFLLLAGSIISRPTFLLLLPFFIWERLKIESLKKTSIELIFFILPFLPFLIVNSLHYRTLTLLRSKGGIVFLIGNNPYAKGTSGMPSFYWKKLSKKWEGLNPAEKDKMAYRIAFKFIKDNPEKFLKLLWRKTLLFWGREEIPNNVNVLYASQISYLKFIPLSFAVILPFSLIGLYSSLHNFRQYILFYGGIIGIYLMTILFLVVGRYRLSEIFFLTPFFVEGIDFSLKKRAIKMLPALISLYTLWFYQPIKNSFLSLTHPHGFIDKNSSWLIRDEDGKVPPSLWNHRYKALLEKKGEGIYKELYLPSLIPFSKAFLKIYIYLPEESETILTINNKSRKVKFTSHHYPFWGWAEIPLPVNILRKGKNEIFIERLSGKVGIFLDDKFNFHRSAFRSSSGDFYFREQDRKSHLKHVPCALGNGEFKVEIGLRENTQQKEQ